MVWWYTAGRSIQYLRSRSKSKLYGTGVVRRAIRSSARSDSDTGESPGGAPRHFWLHE